MNLIFLKGHERDVIIKLYSTELTLTLESNVRSYLSMRRPFEYEVIQRLCPFKGTKFICLIK